MGVYKLGIIIRQLRLQKQFTQKQLAEGICSVEYISKIEHEIKCPSREMTSKLFHRLGVNPDLFYTNLSTTDNDLFNEHCFHIDQLFSTSQYEEAAKYIHSLEKDYSFYAAGEPMQYLMGKKSHILANLDKNFEKAYDMAYQSILLTKSDFTLEKIEEYKFYSINELWAMLYMASAFYWKQKHFLTGVDISPAICLVSTIITHLDRGYYQPSLIGTLYASAVFYQSRFLYSANHFEKACETTDKGLQFITSHYNQIIELLGKIMMNRAACAFATNQFVETNNFYEMGKTLLTLAGNEETLHRYLDLERDTLFVAFK